MRSLYVRSSCGGLQGEEVGLNWILFDGRANDWLERCEDFVWISSRLDSLIQGQPAF